MSTNVTEFYDEFTDFQVGSGVHKRHYIIQEWLEKFGMLPNHDVLEIGCGIGTVTGLIASFLDSGSLTAIDISPKSVELAQKRLKDFKNVNLDVHDFTSTDLNKKFDVILMPDVLEHIPMELHQDLFARMNSHLKEDGFILLHIPDPDYLAWLHVNNPKALQVIDQPLYGDHLCPLIYNNGLTIRYWNKYGIWVNHPDSQLIILNKSPKIEDYKGVNTHFSLFDRVIRKIKSSKFIEDFL